MVCLCFIQCFVFNVTSEGSSELWFIKLAHVSLSLNNDASYAGNLYLSITPVLLNEQIK